MRRHQRGSSLVEAVIALPVFFILVYGLFVSSYLLYCHFWLKYRVYEDSICAAEQRDLTECQLASRRWIERVLPIGHTSRNSVRRTQELYSAWVEFEAFPPLPIISHDPIVIRREHWISHGAVHRLSGLQ